MNLLQSKLSSSAAFCILIKTSTAWKKSLYFKSLCDSSVYFAK